MVDERFHDMGLRIERATILLVRFMSVRIAAALIVLAFPAAAQNWPDPGSVALQMQIETIQQENLSMNSALLRRIQEIELRLVRMNDLVESSNRKLELTSKNLEQASSAGYFDKVRDLRDDISKSVVEIAGIKYDIANHSLGIVGLTLTILLAAGGTSGFIFQKWLKTGMIDEVNRQIDARVGNITKISTTVSMADMLSELSYIYWKNYGDDFLKLIMDERYETDRKYLRREASIASLLARSGLKALNAIKQEEVPEKQRSRFTQRQLLLSNHKVYNMAAELICRKEEPIDGKELADILYEAEKLYRLSVEKESAKFWFELQDAVALIFRYFGDQKQKDRAKSMILSITDGKRPTDDHEVVPQERMARFKIHHHPYFEASPST